jgi:hypothetical protein
MDYSKQLTAQDALSDMDQSEEIRIKGHFRAGHTEDG